ncbi:unnamed protein product [Ectocarpus sp. 12 AP-2014]
MSASGTTTPSSPLLCHPAPAEPVAARKEAFASSNTPPAAAIVEAFSGHTDGTEGQDTVRWEKAAHLDYVHRICCGCSTDAPRRTNKGFGGKGLCYLCDAHPVSLAFPATHSRSSISGTVLLL